MARYLGSQCKRMRREGIDLGLKSAEKPIESKCKFKVPPGQHGAKKGGRSTVYGFQLRAKQVIKRMYGVLERQFRNYYFTATRKKGATGEILLQLLEMRLDNIFYRLGFASTRAEARQIILHKGVMVNNKVINIPSYQVRVEDIISLSEKAKNQLRIKASIDASKARPMPEWLTVDHTAMTGSVKYLPQRTELPPELNENAVVELYSK